MLRQTLREIQTVHVHDVDVVVVENLVDGVDLSLVHPRQCFVQRPIGKANREERAARRRTFTRNH